MKLKQILLSKGWTEDQVAAAFADSKVLEALDDIYGTVTSERDQAKALNDEWQRKLDSEYNPAIAKAEKDAQAARLRTAELEEQVKIARDYGYLSGDEAERRAAEAAEEAKRRANPDNYDPRRHPTFDDVAKFADAEGEAIALATDLAAQYQHYTGGSIHEYETRINGQAMSGMRALRKEAQLARKPLDAFVAEKFDFEGKRKAKLAAAETERENRIRNEEREKVTREMAEKYGNPMMATPIPSRSPFMPGKSSSDGKQPWERGTEQQRRADRIKHAVQSQMQSGAVH